MEGHGQIFPLDPPLLRQMMVGYWRWNHCLLIRTTGQPTKGSHRPSPSARHPPLNSELLHSFIHSGHFYSAPSSPLPLRGAPDYSTDTVSEFHAEAHRQLQVN